MSDTMDDGQLHVLFMSDLHFAASAADRSAIPTRQSEFGPILLRKAIARLQYCGVTPDVIVLLGDLVEKPTRQDLGPIAEAGRCSGARLIAVPGNHDYAPDLYRELFDSEPGLCEVGPYGFLSFWDEFNDRDETERSAEGLALPGEVARARRDLIRVALQHNPIYPDIDCKYPYMPLNAEAIRMSYRGARVALSVSGHYHGGQPASELGGVTYHTLGAGCESPFRFTHVVLDGRNADVRPLHLRLDEPGVWDCHCHTQMAYCATTSEVPLSLELARELGVAGVCLTEHCFQLYFERKYSWSYRWKSDLAMVHDTWREGRGRMGAYRELVAPLRERYAAGPLDLRVGLEVDLLCDGSLLIAPEDRDGLDILVGAVHEIHDYQPGASQAQAERLFMRDVERLLVHPIQILAHPFRWFRRKKLPAPRHLHAEVAALLAEHGVAAEINYHTNAPDVAFYEECLARGVKISFGSDTHAIEEAGEFYPHLQVLMRAGGDGVSLADVLYRPS
jgi:histidinol phosphatase-like PHP family hydrolase/calcineurin-like phosphoesterase family protein